MKNILVAVIGVLTMTLFVGSSFATAPVAGDIPDVRLLTGSGTVDDFDLNDYVTDYDDDPASLNWTIQSQVGFTDVSDPASLVDSLLDIAGSSVKDQGVVTYRVADASEYSEDTQVVKYSSFWLAGPSLTQDNNLVPPDDFPRTWVLEADTVLTTPALADLLVGTASVDNMYACIADLAGDWKAGDNATSASYDGLDVSISGSGELVLQTATLPLEGNLTGAYRVGVKAKKTSGGLAGTEDNWDGMELLVASARVPLDDRSGETAVSQSELDKFGGFESTAESIAYANLNDMRTNGALWAQVSGTGAASIVTSQPAAAWATSGNALQIQLDATEDVLVQSEFFTDIQPGETLTFQANVTTDAAAGQPTANVMLFMGNFQMPSNYQGVSLQTIGTDGSQIPTGGAAGWRTIKATFKADTVGAAVDDVSGPVSFYQGYQCAIFCTNNQAGTVNVYIDNVRVFKSVDPIDAALGATEIAVDKQAGGDFDGTVETAADLAGLGFTESVAGGTAVINTVAANNMFTHDGSKSLEVYVPAGTSGLTEFLYARVKVDVADQGTGIFGASVWMKTNSPDIQSNPDVMLVLTDPQFRNVPFVFSGYVGAPLDGDGWKKISVDTCMQSTFANLWIVLSVKQGGALTPRGFWPDSANDAGVNTPGIQSDAHVFFDDFKVHKYQDDVTYFDRSVFPATD